MKRLLLIAGIVFLLAGCNDKNSTTSNETTSNILYEGKQIIYDASDLGYNACKNKWSKKELDDAVSGMILEARITKYQTIPYGATHICKLTPTNPRHRVIEENVFFIAATPEILDSITIKNKKTKMGRCWEISSRKEYKP